MGIIEISSWGRVIISVGRISWLMRRNNHELRLEIKSISYADRVRGCRGIATTNCAHIITHIGYLAHTNIMIIPLYF